MDANEIVHIHTKYIKIVYHPLPSKSGLYPHHLVYYYGKRPNSNFIHCYSTKLVLIKFK